PASGELQGSYFLPSVKSVNELKNNQDEVKGHDDGSPCQNELRHRSDAMDGFKSLEASTWQNELSALL
ncbi:hypothetical protein, partial [Vibrio maritimus]|uniref:hypothetical protein n=1 Tax=Vibrio maritimus TaxID=990268 RepID=UPI0040693515